MWVSPVNTRLVKKTNDVLSLIDAVLGLTDIRYSFVYYLQVPESSSSLHFSKDPETEEATILPINQGVCVVWDRGLPHCVPPSNHLGRCVISGNLKWKKFKRLL